MKFQNLFLVFICIINLSNAQFSSSPYTLLGVGQTAQSGSGAMHSMGGAGIALPSKQSINVLNPASFGGLDSLSFLFELGISVKYSEYESGSTINSLGDGNLSFIGLAFRLTPWWGLSAGALPYTSVGYTINTTDQVDGNNLSYPKSFKGEGGITRFYLANTISPIENLSFGVNTSYFLGKITRSEIVSASNSEFGYQIEAVDKVHAVYADFGLQYRINVKNTNIQFGATYGRKKSLRTNQDAWLYHLADTVDVELRSTHYSIPRTIGIGLAVIQNDRIKLALDYERANWSNVEVYSNNILKTRDSQRFALGVEYIPQKRYNAKGWKQLRFRGGINYKQTYLIIKDQGINSMSAIAGIGIPLKSDLSLLNLSLELGRMGTERMGLIKETYGAVHLNFSLHDQWFRKYKYD